MWIFLKDSFLSIVADRDRPERLLVRARFRGDLEQVFPGLKNVTELPTSGADYRFRVSLRRDLVAQVLAELTEAVDYPNFKNAVQEDWRHQAYLGVWSRMLAEQERRRPPRHTLTMRGWTEFIDPKVQDIMQRSNAAPRPKKAKKKSRKKNPHRSLRRGR